MEIVLSEKEENARYIAYIFTSLQPVYEACGAKTSLVFGGGRIALKVCAGDRYGPYLRKFTEEKVAEVISVGYKYDVFSRALHTAGLGAGEREILLAALISADFADDRRYIFSRLRGMKTYTVDGFYLFRLGALKRKWEEVTACVPAVFTGEKLAAFMGYLLREETGEKVFVRGSELYDGRYRKLRRATLIEEGVSEMNAVREIILSGAGEVECVGAPTPCQENFLRRYFAGKVSFT